MLDYKQEIRISFEYTDIFMNTKYNYNQFFYYFYIPYPLRGRAKISNK